MEKHSSLSNLRSPYHLAFFLFSQAKRLSHFSQAPLTHSYLFSGHLQLPATLISLLYSSSTSYAPTFIIIDLSSLSFFLFVISFPSILSTPRGSFFFLQKMWVSLQDLIYLLLRASGFRCSIRHVEKKIQY